MFTQRLMSGCTRTVRVFAFPWEEQRASHVTFDYNKGKTPLFTFLYLRYRISVPIDPQTSNLINSSTHSPVG